jgi:hypothetical protein
MAMGIFSVHVPYYTQQNALFTCLAAITDIYKEQGSIPMYATKYLRSRGYGSVYSLVRSPSHQVTICGLKFRNEQFDAISDSRD